jgi:hypothetical protein
MDVVRLAGSVTEKALDYDCGVIRCFLDSGRFDQFEYAILFFGEIMNNLYFVSQYALDYRQIAIMKVSRRLDFKSHHIAHFLAEFHADQMNGLPGRNVFVGVFFALICSLLLRNQSLGILA